MDKIFYNSYLRMIDQIKNILVHTTVDEYKFLGHLEVEDLYQWFWQEIGGLERIIFLSIDTSDGVLDAMINCNYGIVDSMTGGFEKDKITNENIELLKEWIDENLYSIGHITSRMMHFEVNHINAYLAEVFKKLNLGEYLPVGFIYYK